DIDQWRKPSTTTFDGDARIEEHETITGNVVVKAGNLVVFGRVEGDVLVVGGTLFVKNGARITGNARVINGDVVREEDGVIEGYVDQTTASTASYRYDRGRFTRSGYRFEAPWTDHLTNLDNFLYHFNRAEGHFLGLGSEKKYFWDGSRSVSPYGFIGWGFKSHRWRGLIGIDRQFSLATSDENAGHILELGAEGHSLTDSKESWIIGTNENTAAAVLIHEDFHDYFQREGFSLHAGYYYRKGDIQTQLRIEFAGDRYESLERRTEWSIFGGKKVFRPNPPVDEGHMRSVIIRPGFSTVERTSRGQHGWCMYATAEIADKRLGGDFSFSTLVADVRRYQPISRYDDLNIRIRMGTSGGRLPAQRVFEMGGLGTLHARPYKSDAGNRMILLNAEYILNADIFNDLDFWPSWLFSRINLIFIADAGFTRSVPRDFGWTEGFDAIQLSDFKNDMGFGVSNRAGSWRVGFVWQTDRKAPAKFFFRFTRPF
ncbi:MAG: hypothetical protein HY563_03015, partial [Ignavibacteriales bacterium]|nr:hypothetical protein [Ignavibacteriales bacterium]